MPPFGYRSARRIVRPGLVGLSIIGLVVAVRSLEPTTVSGPRIDELRSRWAALLDAEDAAREEQIRAALTPVNEYFDDVALPHVADFLADFSGLFYDTPRFVYKWTADKMQFRGRSDRVKEQVRASLAKHLGFPDQLNTSVRASIERFHTLQQQRDADLRDKAYALLHGAGVTVDQASLDNLLHKAHQTAEQSTLETLSRDSAVDFGGAILGKEVGILALQTLIVERAVVALGIRMGVVTAGAGAAGGTAAVGTATGVGAIPGWTLAAAEIAVTIVVDLAASHWLESKAEAKMCEQLRLARSELRLELSRYMQQHATEVRVQRLALLDQVLSH